MNLSKHGKNISKVEIGAITTFGVWILVNGIEYFLPHEKYPWFKQATVEEVLDVKLIRNKHLFWPKLDIDLSIEILENPERFPLIANS